MLESDAVKLPQYLKINICNTIPEFSDSLEIISLSSRSRRCKCLLKTPNVRKMGLLNVLPMFEGDLDKLKTLYFSERELTSNKLSVMYRRLRNLEVLELRWLYEMVKFLGDLAKTKSEKSRWKMLKLKQISVEMCESIETFKSFIEALPMLDKLYGENQIKIKFKTRDTSRRELELMWGLLKESAAIHQRCPGWAQKGLEDLKGR